MIVPRNIGRLCIITPPHYISETFIRIHESRLKGEKVILTGDYPDYVSDGHMIRYRYTKHRRFRRLWRILPYFIYKKNIGKFEPEGKVVRAFLNEFMEQNRVDVIFAEYGFTGADITPVAKALKIPLVVHFHGHDAYHRQYLADYRERLSQMFAYAAAIVSVSHDMTEQLIRLGAPADRIVLNPYGPREHFFEIKPRYSKVILALGRLVETKAPHLTICAFRLLLDECPDVKLIMAGDGPLRSACMDLAAGLGIGDRIEFPGAVPADQTKDLFARACCFVQHSVTTSEGVREGTPVAILEAGAAGLPVVSTRHAGINQAVIHGETGYLVEERDVTGMKDYLKILIEDPERCRSMGQGAREHIRLNYGIDRHVECLQSLVDRCRN